MNEQISWDPSLVKKFSSSNHFKMLNQLRSEVKKYPLTKKKNLSSNVISENKYANKANQNEKISKEISFLKTQNSTNEAFNNQSTVSFNNSKNFSIYNTSNNELTKEKKVSQITDEKIITEKGSYSVFKDRPSQIDS
tara:strand:- start:154 stop:564 length:411 start_codon:yes stop_codon:yes gene_type:complete